MHAFAGLQGHIAILKCSAILLFQNCITNRQLKFIMQGQGLIHKICRIIEAGVHCLQKYLLHQLIPNCLFSICGHGVPLNGLTFPMS